MSLDRNNKITDIISMYRSDYRVATMITSGFSSCANVVFAVFNGIFGILHLSVWHISVFFYYSLLLGIKGYIIASIRKKRSPKTVYIKTHILLVFMNLSMIVPVAIMVNGEHKYEYGLIPAIAMAAYTTYRITMSAIHLKKSRRSDILLVKELRTINFIDALVAITALQNTMIMANGGMSRGMSVLCAWTNGGIIFLIFIITVRSFCSVKSQGKNT